MNSPGAPPSWPDWTPAKVVGVPADQMGRRAPRLKYAVMEMAALRAAGFSLPRPWQEALADYIRTLSL